MEACVAEECTFVPLENIHQDDLCGRLARIAEGVRALVVYTDVWGDLFMCPIHGILHWCEGTDCMLEVGTNRCLLTNRFMERPSKHETFFPPAAKRHKTTLVGDFVEGGEGGSSGLVSRMRHYELQRVNEVFNNKYLLWQFAQGIRAATTDLDFEPRRLDSIIRRTHALFTLTFNSDQHVRSEARLAECEKRYREIISILRNAKLGEQNASRINELVKEGLCNRTAGAQFRKDTHKLIIYDLLEPVDKLLPPLPASWHI